MSSRRRTDGRVDGVQTEHGYVHPWMKANARWRPDIASVCIEVILSIAMATYVAWLLQFSMVSDVLSLRQYHDRRWWVTTASSSNRPLNNATGNREISLRSVPGTRPTARPSTVRPAGSLDINTVTDSVYETRNDFHEFPHHSAIPVADRQPAIRVTVAYISVV